MENFFLDTGDLMLFTPQVVVDTAGRIRYIESWFLEHQNDAHQYVLMRQIGTDLPFP